MKVSNKVVIEGNRSVSLRTAPVTEFFHASREIQAHLGVTSVLSAFMEDLAAVENGLGNKLTKLGKSTVASSDSNALTEINDGWENIFRFVTTNKGKQCSSLSSTISQVICKSFPDTVRSLSKRIQVITSKIQSLADNLAKARQAHYKSLDRYARQVQDTENAIRSRDAAAAVESNDAKQPDKEQDFVNRSFNKVQIIPPPPSTLSPILFNSIHFFSRHNFVKRSCLR